MNIVTWEGIQYVDFEMKDSNCTFKIPMETRSSCFLGTFRFLVLVGQFWKPRSWHIHYFIQFNILVYRNGYRFRYCTHAVTYKAYIERKNLSPESGSFPFVGDTLENVLRCFSTLIHLNHMVCMICVCAINPKKTNCRQSCKKEINGNGMHIHQSHYCSNLVILSENDFIFCLNQNKKIFKRKISQYDCACLERQLNWIIPIIDRQA